MNNQKSLESLFQKLFPFLAIAAYMIVYAVIFNTFDLAIHAALYNILLALPLFGLLLMLTRRYSAAILISVVVVFALFYIDQFVLSTRLTHIRFSDFNLISQAARVARRYRMTWNFEMTRRLTGSLLITGFLFVIVYYYKLKYEKKSVFITGLVLFVLSGSVIISGVVPSSGAEDFNFNEDAEKRGLLYSWYSQIHNSAFAAPEGYRKEAAEQALNSYRSADGDNDIRIIVIMNESLADYCLVGTPRFQDPIPFIHSLVDRGEAFEGKLNVSVFGGGTANSEFEFLTGCSTAFLPEGSTPYLQFVDHKMESIVSDLGDCRKIAIHPYYSEEWNRTQVYRFFGFDQFISGIDFGSEVETNGMSATSRPSDNIVSFGEGPLYVRGLISDKSCFERIVEENADFTFAVTMQNHGSYGYKGGDFTNQEYVTETVRKDWAGERSLLGLMYTVETNSVEEELFYVNQYLTLSRLSDQAFEELIDTLRRDKHKTIVLMFGDHQPGIMISEHYVDIDGGADRDYTVPYILWANYDIEFDAPEITSPNYLSAILKKNAGLPLTAWDQFRLEMMEEYPVVTVNYVLDADGNSVGKGVLKDYEYLQYMRMFE